jgi:hypothetical protein
MKILSVGMCFLLTAVLQVNAQVAPLRPKAGGGKETKEGNCGLLYGKDHSLTFCAPDGWQLDNGILNDQGIFAVFYPVGSSWQEAKDSGTMMYINVVGKPTDSTVAQMMAADADDAKRSAPSTQVQPGEAIKIGELAAPILRFAPGAFNRYEAVAYLGEEKVLVMFVMSSKNEEFFKKDYPAFVRLVQSYKFLSSNVTIEHK